MPKSSHVRKPSEVNENNNTNWVGMPGAWFFYSAAVFVGWLVLCAFYDSGTAWTILNLIHAVITFVCFHWLKGSPLGDDQGKYATDTFWEQLDDGVQNTGNRKFFTLVPVALYLLAVHTNRENAGILAVNTIAMVVLVLAKMPFMHGVRILGINKW